MVKTIESQSEAPPQSHKDLLSILTEKGLDFETMEEIEDILKSLDDPELSDLEEEDEILFNALIFIAKFTPNTYKFHTPTNTEEEKERFFTAIKAGNEYNPKFAYKSTDTPDTTSLLEKLTLIQIFLKKIGRETPLRRIYTRVGVDTARLLILASTSQTSLFPEASRRAYKDSSVSTSEVEKNVRMVLGESAHDEEHDESTFIKSVEFKKLMEELVEKVGVDVTVRIIPGDEMSARTSAGNGFISISSTFNVPLSEAVRMAIHEIGHSITQQNGKKNLLKTGNRRTSRSLQIEEGVNIQLEKLLIETLCEDEKLGFLKEGATLRDILPSIRLLGVRYAETMSFHELFHALKAVGVNDEIAWATALRSKRGLSDVGEPGANFKDVSYYLGQERVERYLREKGAQSVEERLQALKELTQGRFSDDESSYLRYLEIPDAELDITQKFHIITDSIKEFIVKRIQTEQMTQQPTS